MPPQALLPNTVSLVLIVSIKEAQQLGALVQTGHFGFGTEQAAERLLSEKLREMEQDSAEGSQLASALQPMIDKLAEACDAQTAQAPACVKTPAWLKRKQDLDAASARTAHDRCCPQQAPQPAPAPFDQMPKPTALQTTELLKSDPIPQSKLFGPHRICLPPDLVTEIRDVRPSPRTRTAVLTS